MEEEKSKILIIGGTGLIGKHLVEASAKYGHPTFTLVREKTLSDPNKAHLLESFKKSGVTILIGDVNDHGSLMKAIKMVDVVISALGYQQIADQFKLIDAIKEAGNVKRFLPSEFGFDVERCSVVEPLKSDCQRRIRIRRAIEAAGIPYTYIIPFFFSGYGLVTFLQVGAAAPPRERVVIPGDGNVKVVFNAEPDVAAYTIKAAVDPRTLNKTLYIKPPGSVYSLNELIESWEKKIGKTLEKTYLTEQQLLKKIEEMPPFPLNAFLAMNHSISVNGTDFDVHPDVGVEASQLYPDVKYTTVDQYLTQLL